MTNIQRFFTYYSFFGVFLFRMNSSEKFAISLKLKGFWFSMSFNCMIS
jgi:hypothetical protein